MVRLVGPVALAVVSLACNDEAPAGVDSSLSPTDTTPSPPDSAPTEPGIEVITLETSDGVTLEADYWPAATAGAPGVVLLHMIPPANDRTSWPASFVAQLHDADYAVIVLDRRGAGGSEGVASEAYLGPNGKLDVAAAADRLAADGFGALAILGASNGTTSMIDYADWASGAGHPAPAALGYLTGGTYTEAQTPMSAVEDFPSLFTYSTAERAWSEDQRSEAPASLQVFREYPSGDHGTRMFDVVPTFGDDLLAFLSQAIPR